MLVNMIPPLPPIPSIQKWIFSLNCSLPLSSAGPIYPYVENNFVSIFVQLINFIKKKKKFHLCFFKRFIVWGGQYKQVFPFGGGGGRKELERDIYAKIYKWLGLTGSNRYKVLTYFGWISWPSWTSSEWKRNK